MCGIVGYIGKRKATPILLEGIRRLEYRGYDSTGIAVVEKDKLNFLKTPGKISELEQKMGPDFSPSTLGIGHTRWATHGEPNEANAHPHFDSLNQIAVVHNGIIENYMYLKDILERQGHTFKSNTDTEIIAHLIEKYMDGNLEFAVQRALKEVEGAYGIAVVSSRDPHKLVAARNGSPLIIGVGNVEYFVSSDVAALYSHTKQIVYLEDNEMVTFTREGYKTTTIDNIPVKKKIEEVSWNIDMIEKGGYHHFMAKEIHEQPDTIHDAMLGRVDFSTFDTRLGGIHDHLDTIQNAERIIISACGTSWHAALIGEYLLEEFTRIPVEVEYASEFRYRNPIIDEHCVFIVISQSGETADTLAALREAKKRGATCLGICNVVGSTIARESHAGIYIHAGPEIGVASTKAFTSQLVVLYLMTILLGVRKGIIKDNKQAMVSQLLEMPDKARQILKEVPQIKELAQLYHHWDNFLYLGRGYNFPVALEGALKLKEISYIHAEGYPAAEMKHGPIALINENMPIVFIATRDAAYDKILSNIAEVKARKGRVIVIATEGDTDILKYADHAIYIPQVLDPLTPLLSVIPLQLLAYHIAVLRHCDVDRPRNLAKSVTVE